jgi:hypothetical protein
VGNPNVPPDLVASVIDGNAEAYGLAAFEAAGADLHPFAMASLDPPMADPCDASATTDCRFSKSQGVGPECRSLPATAAAYLARDCDAAALAAADRAYRASPSTLVQAAAGCLLQACGRTPPAGAASPAPACRPNAKSRDDWARLLCGS